MWIVRVALSRPYTFVVLALFISILGPFVISRMPTDIFPSIPIPVVSVIWGYTGLPPTEMSNRITSGFERAVTTTVNDIEHIESQSLTGISVTKLFFHPTVDINMALSQVTAVSQTMLRAFPPGTTPPLILSYNASTVPILQIALFSATLTEQNMNDLANNFIRTQLATVQGAAMPSPYGGKVPQVQVDLNPKAMQAHGVSAQDISNAIGQQNLILPAGTEKIGLYEYIIQLNASPSAANALNDIPVNSGKGNTLYLRDVAHVREGFAPQTNIVKVDGLRAVLISILKTGSASTLAIINKIKSLLPNIRENLPENLSLALLSDQSIFVKAAIQGVIQEGILSACLTALMILCFLGSWRSTLLIAVSIPLSILTSLVGLWSLGETINMMTLGGLALAIGILVDDATVAVENINWQLEQNKPIETAILDGAQQITLPALVSTLCICIVFIPMFLLTGVARFLFIPMAEGVIFAMLASYLLSRTLVPTLAKYWLPQAHSGFSGNAVLSRFQAGFEQFRQSYRHSLSQALENKPAFMKGFIGFSLVSLIGLGPCIGSDFFPTVDAGQIKLHIRAHSGLRVEETAKLCDEIEQVIHQVIPSKETASIIQNIGMPNSGINLSYSNSSPIGPSDADFLISLTENHHDTADYVRSLRERLNQAFPSVYFLFLPADMVGQILNFGLPAPIDVQIIGFNPANRDYTNHLFQKIRQVPGIVDAHIHQTFDYPMIQVEVDRTRADQLGITEYNVANNLLISLSGSFQTTPAFWLNPKTGVSYPIVTQMPQYDLTSLDQLRNISINGSTPTKSQILGALSTLKRGSTSGVESHYNVQPTLDIYAAVQDRDLGSVSKDIHAILKKTATEVPKGSIATVRGQILTQAESFSGLYLGIAFAILLSYLLMVVNFQSWKDPLIIISALPVALAGILWMLFLTHTTLSVPALTGCILCTGVATANSILVVSFAREQMKQGIEPLRAALEAGCIRLRPVLMTALAMIIGMVPMALGLGDGGEQNAPLGRAVIGGLLLATGATLYFVPVIFSHFYQHQPELGEPSHAPL